MPEPFKNFFNVELIKNMAVHLVSAEPGFDEKRFISLASDGLDELELKQRSAQIQLALGKSLPEDFPQACNLMIRALHPSTESELGDMSMDDKGIRGWSIMPMADYVAEHGLQHFDLALETLAEMTKRFSAEFAVRHFFQADWQRTMKIAHAWAESDNFHVRRLASEGSRPRLPWGIQLTTFVEDPSPLLPLLEKLKNDNHEYVRRSVANNLNDIAKDHPDIVAKTVDSWMKKANADETRMIKHACRTLIKNGHKPTLKALGFSDPQIKLRQFSLEWETVKLGESLEFNIEIESMSDRDQPLVIDFIIHHKKANGELTPKVFKWKNATLAANDSLSASKKHTIKPITTRVYYEGVHELELQINGQTIAKKEFVLNL